MRLGAWGRLVDVTMEVTTGGDGGDEAPKPRRCNWAAAWRDTGGSSLRTGSCLVQSRAGRARPELHIFKRILDSTRRASMRAFARFVLRPCLRLGSRRWVSCLR